MYCEKCGKYSGRYPLCKNCYYEENDEENLSFEEWEDVSGECLICGNDSGEYLFCRECYYQYKNKTITLQCKNCDEFELIDDCIPQDGFENDETDRKCIICENSAGTYLFCRDCYSKYKNKTLFLKAENCDSFKLLDAEYASPFLCEDGHKVKSPYEQIIDDWLYHTGILHAYEKIIPLDKNHKLTPDFYIPKLKRKDGTILNNIYIEFWGYGKSNISYQNTKDYKTEIYPQLCQRDNITVIYINKQEVENNSYKMKIAFAEPGKVNE
ncbi:MAG: hypothetical protein IJX39_06080 [Clostridia bacterium]|nr:hypothetical protein [Clostridia bacterium]